MGGLRYFAVAGARICALVNDVRTNAYFSGVNIHEAGGAKHVLSPWFILHGKTSALCGRLALQCSAWPDLNQLSTKCSRACGALH